MGGERQKKKNDREKNSRKEKMELTEYQETGGF